MTLEKDALAVAENAEFTIGPADQRELIDNNAWRDLSIEIAKAAPLATSAAKSQDFQVEILRWRIAPKGGYRLNRDAAERKAASAIKFAFAWSALI